MEKKWISILTMAIVAVLLIFLRPTEVFAQEDPEIESAYADITLAAGSDEEEAKQEEKEVISQIEEGEVLLLMADEEDMVSRAATSRASTTVSLVKGETLYYDSWITCYFSINGNLAYCLEPSAASPNSGSYAATVLAENKLLTKALYYLVGGPGYTSTLEKQFFPDSVGNHERNYCISHVVLSYIYDNCSTSGDAFTGVSSATIQQVKKITALIEGLSTAPDAELSISPSSQESSYVKSDGIQKTGNFKLTGDVKNHITITLPDDVTIHNQTTDKSSTGKVKVSGGDKFYFTAPLTVTGTWKTGKVYGAITDQYKALVINEGNSSQTVGSWSYTIAGDVAPVSFSVKWLDMGQISLKKVSSDAGATADGVDDAYYSLKGATFEVRNSSGTVMDTLVTDEKGEAVSKLLPFGKYKLVETRNPTGYLFAADASVELESVSAPVTIKEQPQYGKIELQKKSGDTKATADGVDDSYYTLKGAVYEVFNSKGTVVTTLTTDAAGNASTGNLPLGKYTVKEKPGSPSVGYVADPTVHEADLTSENRTDKVFVKKVTSTETPQYGQIEVMKKSGDAGATADGVDDNFYTLAGAVYEVFHAKGTIVASITTNAEGKAVTGNLPLGKYKVKEKAGSSSKGYLVDLNTYEVEITSENRASTIFVKGITSIETPQYGQIELKKVDSETGKDEAQGAASLEKATYQLYNSAGTLLETVTTDRRGRALFGKYPLGTYIVKEVNPSKGYLIDQKTYTVKIESTDRVTPLFVKIVTSGEDIIRGDVQLVKFRESQDTEEEIKTPLSGIQFTFTSKTTGKVVRTITTDKNGYASTAVKEHPRGGLLYDTYLVEEVADTVPKGVKVIDPFEVTISEEGVTHYFIIEDKNIVSPLTVVKKDRTTGNIIPVANTEFRLLDENKKAVTMTTYYPDKVVYETFKTGENGQFTFPEKLAYGTYYLEEVRAPQGYLKGGPLEIKIEKGHKWEEPFVVEYFDEPALGKIIVHKTDADTEANVEGAEFTVTAKEDIVTADGTVRLEAGEVAAVITTNRNGMAFTDKLFLGVYEVEETKVPVGYVKPADKKTVELKYENQEITLVKEVVEVANQPTKFILTKIKQGDSKRPLSGVEFAFWEKAKGENEELEKETMITDEQGRITLQYLEPGTYCFQEVTALPGFLLDDTIFEITIDEQGLVDGERVGALTVENEFTKVDISKQEVTGEQEIEGAEMELVDSEGKTIEMWVSGKEPHRIEELTPGDYILKENLAPAGYLAAGEVKFTVSESGEVQQVTMYDEVPMGRVLIHKTDKANKKALGGVEYELLDMDGKVLETLVTDESGKAVSQLYPIGTYENGAFTEVLQYRLIESKALDGYAIDKTVYEIIFEYVDGKTPVIDVPFELTNELIPEKTETEEESKEPKKEPKETTPAATPGEAISKASDVGKTAVSSAPKTGDRTSLAVLLLLLAASAGSIVVMVYKKKYKK